MITVIRQHVSLKWSETHFVMSEDSNLREKLFETVPSQRLENKVMDSC